jgi:hypothetical protein
MAGHFQLEHSTKTRGAELGPKGPLSGLGALDGPLAIHQRRAPQIHSRDLAHALLNRYPLELKELRPLVIAFLDQPLVALLEGGVTGPRGPGGLPGRLPGRLLGGALPGQLLEEADAVAELRGRVHLAPGHGGSAS